MNLCLVSFNLINIYEGFENKISKYLYLLSELASTVPAAVLVVVTRALLVLQQSLAQNFQFMNEIWVYLLTWRFLNSSSQTLHFVLCLIVLSCSAFKVFSS